MGSTVWLAQVIALYTDGGVIAKTPSAIGGTWAWCAVDEQGSRLLECGGVVPVTDTRPLITNNHMEQIAIVKALEAMPAGWSGTLYSDSQVALGRVFQGWRTANLPRNVTERSRAAVARLGQVKWTLLQGHPTKADLAVGMGKKRGLPVSVHNVWCDQECGRQAAAYPKNQKLGLVRQEQNG